MPPNYIIILRPARPTFPGDATPEERDVIGRHFDYLKALADEGVIFLAGRTDEQSPEGIVLIAAESPKAAEYVLKDDPAVRAGVFKGELKPFRLAILQE